MRSNKLTFGLTLVLATFSLTALLGGTNAAAQTERILHNFSNNGQGESLYTGLIFDAAGNLYGTTGVGGAYGSGTVFELSPNSSGGWTQKILHNFGNGSDGQSPWGGSLLMDTSGNLYGTTRYGGTSLCDSLNPIGCGTVFELLHNSNGSWTEKVLHNFGGGADEDGPNGYHPYGGLVMDAAGNLYGTTFYGGTYGGALGFGGVVFELSSSGNGNWSEQLLWSFGLEGDGNFPQGTLVFDEAGNLYGTTESGTGSSAGGTVFELSPGAGGWTENIIFQFDVGGDSETGNSPQAGVVFDANGNLYGTTGYGGPYFMGNVFELTPSGGVWTETVLHTFSKGDGNTPDAGVIVDGAGNLYGTTFMGGKADVGIVYKLSPSSGGTWSEKILHDFQAAGVDGTNPLSGLVMDSHGFLYGTTANGGIGGLGTVFEVRP